MRLSCAQVCSDRACVVGVRIVRLGAFTEAHFERRGGCGWSAAAPDRKAKAGADADAAVMTEAAAAYANAKAWAGARPFAIHAAAIDPEPIAIVLERQIGGAQQCIVLQRLRIGAAGGAIGDAVAIGFDLLFGIAGGVRPGRRAVRGRGLARGERQRGGEKKSFGL